MRMDASNETGVLLVLVLLFLGSGGHTVDNSQTQVECIVYNHDYLVCDWGSKQMPTANYSLYYWYTTKEELRQECQNYLQRDGIRVGCRISYVNLYYDFNMDIKASHGRTIPTTPVQLINRVKPDPPIDLSLRNISNNQLLLTWNNSYRFPRCLEYMVKYKSNKDTAWMMQNTEQMRFSVPSVDPSKIYTFYVSSKVNNGCGTTNLWSEQAGPLTWGKEEPPPASFMIESILISVGSVLLLLLLVLALMRMERVRLVLIPRIPNPSKKFEDLFTAYQGNFSEWSGFSKDAMESFKPNYRESICHVSELVPGGGYLPVSNDTMGKFGGIVADPHPKVNAE